MPELTGTVRCVRVGDDFAFTTVDEQGVNTSETFKLWWDGVSTPANPPARTRIAQSNWVALLRQAKASNILVTITYDYNSSVVLNVQLGQL
jgi:hypothetical protein